MFEGINNKFNVNLSIFGGALLVFFVALILIFGSFGVIGIVLGISFAIISFIVIIMTGTYVCDFYTRWLEER